MAKIIIDIGNSAIRMVVESDSDRGNVHEIIVPKHPEGMPSAISVKNGKMVVGYEVMTNQKLRVRREDRIKNRLEETIVFRTPDGKTELSVSGREAMKTVFAEALRDAAERVEELYHEKITEIIAAYPGAFLSNRRQRYLNLLQEAAIISGRKVPITATISEPAAAGLDALSFLRSREEQKVLAVSIGHGTIEAAVVSCFPKGRKTAEGKTYYYDIVKADGKVGGAGAAFTAEMEKLIRSKVRENGDDPDKVPAFMIREYAENAKIALSNTESTDVMLMGVGGNMIDFEITRQEYEKQVTPLVNEIVDLTENLIKTCADVELAHVVLTGGGSQMPCIREVFCSRFGTGKGENYVLAHDPIWSVAKGAAAYAVNEADVTQRTLRMLGVVYYKINSDERYVEPFIKAGETIPVRTKEPFYSAKREAGRYSNFTVVEAKSLTPDVNQPDRDFVEIMTAVYDYGKVVPKGTTLIEEMSIDSKNIVHIFVRDPENPKKAPIEQQIQLTNLGEEAA